MYRIEWHKLYKKYNGFCIFPLEHYDNFDTEGIYKQKNLYTTDFASGWDVSSLVLWDNTSIDKYYNLGTIKDIIISSNKISKVNKRNLNKTQQTIFFNNLIQKITSINMSKNVNKSKSLKVHKKSRKSHRKTKKQKI